PLNNINRGVNIAKSSRHSTPINISNSSELKNIKNLSNGLKIGGNALIAYDAYNRSNQVYNDYKSGKDWKKTAVVQSSGLTVGVISGSFTASAVSSAAVSIGLAATPVGWVIAIGIGLTATYYVSTSLDKSTQKAAASLYDFAW
ncbi:hypothetical protein L4C36_23085, partial [Photobacterium japonica]|uniref:hypothetical protein n=1 Tax=Photobacterium japonica TaxID=2910235 RepID=UPI003D1243CE